MYMRSFAIHGAMVGVTILVTHGAINRHADKEAVADRITRLIEQLGDDEFAKREAATRALEAIAAPALVALRKAAASTVKLTLATIRRSSRPSGITTRASSNE